MYNVLVFLLHRPFVADGHLYSTSRSISVDSLMKCASAASSISDLLRAYHKAFSLRRAPYLISYATYVAATIHTRIAAKRGRDSSAHGDLATCLAVFKENQETNSAVKKAALIIQRLMQKHGVVIDEVSSDTLDAEPPSETRENRRKVTDWPNKENRNLGAASVSRDQGTSQVLNVEDNHDGVATGLTPGAENSPGSDWMDVDGIIQSFLLENNPSWTRSSLPSRVLSSGSLYGPHVSSRASTAFHDDGN